MQEIAEAIDLATEAIELHPDTYEGYYSRAKAQLERGAMSDAMQDIQNALQRAADSSMDVRKILLRLQDEIKQRTASSDASTDL